jgi:hypothetical protein
VSQNFRDQGFSAIMPVAVRPVAVHVAMADEIFAGLLTP